MRLKMLIEGIKKMVIRWKEYSLELIQFNIPTLIIMSIII
jgi:hypothetical protein